MINETMRKFGAPGSVIHRYQHWSILLRPVQPTLGALVLAADDPATGFSGLSRESFTEMHKVIPDLEQALSAAFGHNKINYLMLMMVDPDVHFHVIPRYRENRWFEGVEFTDPGWPGPPDISHVNVTGAALDKKLFEYIKANWPMR